MVVSTRGKERTMDEGLAALWRTLGLTEADGELNDTGRRLLDLPLSESLPVRHARIILSGIERGVFADALTLAAMVFSEGIRDRSNELWTMNVGNEQESDLIAELILWKKAETMYTSDLPFIGVHPEAYLRTLRRREYLLKMLAGDGIADVSSGNRQDILDSWLLGYPDHLYRLEHERMYLRGQERRRLGIETVVLEGAEYVVAMPFTVSYKQNDVPVFQPMLKLATKVSLEHMMLLAPHLKGAHKDNYRYFPPRDRVICHLVHTFGVTAFRREVTAGSGLEAVKALAQYLVNADDDLTLTSINSDKLAEVRMLHNRAPDMIGLIPAQALRNWYMERLGECSTLLEVEKRRIDLSLSDEDISQLLHIDYPPVREKILQSRPDTWIVRGGAYPITYSGTRPLYLDLCLPPEVWLEITESDLPYMEGMILRLSTESEQFADIKRQNLFAMQASISVRMSVLRRRQDLIEEFSELQRLAATIDWSQAEAYGITEDEHIPRQLERLERRILNGSTSVDKLSRRVTELRERLLTAINDS